jgi:hypothetical protein|tara:strand:+ start:324 stop:581 length:258 start_codon:yes stop_codon:yes gene_type:complete
MSKMRQFKFWNENGDEKEVEKMSLKKAIIAVQGDFKESVIGVEYISKRGKQISDSVQIPVGRKIRQAMIIEKKKAALKAAKEAGK